LVYQKGEEMIDHNNYRSVAGLTGEEEMEQIFEANMKRAQWIIFAVIAIVAVFFIAISYALAADKPLVPNPVLTPGVVDPAKTKDVICVPGYTSQPGVRNVSEAVKMAVFKEYGIDPKSDQFEIDHLISLELGGSNDIHNLWPQSYTTQPLNAHIKDALENRLHALVCSGNLDLSVAQHDIATDWVGAYNKYVAQKK
jgi:hypothetical protein